MRCPKCHYLSFDPEPRCKNCGYDLEVADAELAFQAAEDYSDAPPDLELRSRETLDLPALTLELRRDVPAADALPTPAPASVKAVPASPAALPVRPQPVEALAPTIAGQPHEDPESMPERTFRIEPVREPVPAIERKPKVAARVVPASSTKPAGVALFDPPAQRPRVPAPSDAVEPVESDVPPAPVTPPAPSPIAAASSPHPTTELPLFVRDAPPRPPLSVRRTVAELPRGRTLSDPPPPARDRRVGPLDRDLLDDLRRVEREEATYASVEARARTTTELARLSAYFDDESDEIPASQRLAAAALDGVLLGGIGTFVLWATLRMTGAGITSVGTDSLIPLLVFLGGVSVAYLLMFTAAGGQTVGKMLMGLRVVGDTAEPGDDRLTVSQAALRAVLAPLSVLVLGLGWLPALFGRGLALHDRLAHTRVVRA